MRHTISVVVENEAGVLSRVAGLFSARGFNIHSLNVAPMEGGDTSHVTLVTEGEEHIIEQIIKQLNKLIPVIRVVDLTEGPHVGRELMLVKVEAQQEARAEVLRVTEIFRARVVDATPASFILEVTGDSAKLDACLALLSPLGILDVVRTGQVAMARGSGRAEKKNG
ncbi:MAG: acetolactate synthase small subunit [Magnetococcales bacterium]|nr:acetolactate synthase small subunit [Magnetococcales bacterium]